MIYNSKWEKAHLKFLAQFDECLLNVFGAGRIVELALRLREQLEPPVHCSHQPVRACGTQTRTRCASSSKLITLFTMLRILLAKDALLAHRVSEWSASARAACAAMASGHWATGQCRWWATACARRRRRCRGRWRVRGRAPRAAQWKANARDSASTRGHWWSLPKYSGKYKYIIDTCTVFSEWIWIYECFFVVSV